MLLLHTITNTQPCSKADPHKKYFMQTQVYLERQEAVLINYTHKAQPWVCPPPVPHVSPLTEKTYL